MSSCLSASILVNGFPRFYHFVVAFCLFACTWPRHKQGAVVLTGTKSVAVLQNPSLHRNGLQLPAYLRSRNLTGRWLSFWIPITETAWFFWTAVGTPLLGFGNSARPEISKAWREWLINWHPWCSHGSRPPVPLKTTGTKAPFKRWALWH